MALWHTRERVAVDKLGHGAALGRVEQHIGDLLFILQGLDGVAVFVLQEDVPHANTVAAHVRYLARQIGGDAVSGQGDGPAETSLPTLSRLQKFGWGRASTKRRQNKRGRVGDGQPRARSAAGQLGKCSKPTNRGSQQQSLRGGLRSLSEAGGSGTKGACSHHDVPGLDLGSCGLGHLQHQTDTCRRIEQQVYTDSVSLSRTGRAQSVAGYCGASVRNIARINRRPQRLVPAVSRWQICDA